MDLMTRRRMMMQEKQGGGTVIEQAITWSGSGSDKTSSVIDATQGAAHFRLSFDSSSSYIESGATSSDVCFKVRDTALYSDAEATSLVGYYQADTGVISSERRSTVPSPNYSFETDIITAPKGYYAKMLICRYGTPFTSNGNFMNYIRNNGNKVTIHT